MGRYSEVIKPDQNIRFNAVIDHWSGVFNFHAQGYKRAAEVLLEYFLQDINKTAGDRDSLVLPILFLFRHYLELRFKDIFVLGSKVLGQDAQWQWGHELDQLWQTCRTVCEGVLGRSFSDRLDAVGRCVEELADLDPKSENFRYPINKDGTPIFEHKVIGLKNLYDVVREIGDFLDSISIDFDQRLRDIAQSL